MAYPHNPISLLVRLMAYSSPCLCALRLTPLHPYLLQFLESYKSVTIDSMASAFDVSPAFLDQEVADFIVAGRLNAKIDKVFGIIETNRPDHKNALYQVREWSERVIQDPAVVQLCCCGTIIAY